MYEDAPSPAPVFASAPAAPESGTPEELCRQAADALLANSYLYLQLIDSAGQLLSQPFSPALERDLMNLRLAAVQLAEGSAWISRTVAEQLTFGAGSDPDSEALRAVRALLQEIGDSCVMISGAVTQADIEELPVFSPDDLFERLDAPWFEAWLERHRSPETEAAPAQPAEHPAAAAPAGPAASPAGPAASPYPSAPELSPYPSVPAAPALSPAPVPVAAPVPAPSPAPAAAPAVSDPAGQRVGERTRGLPPR
jgi:hypothetical protein